MVLKTINSDNAVEVHSFPALDQLREVLQRAPAVHVLGTGRHADGNWWVRVSLDVRNPLVWDVVREFGCVVDYLSPERPWRLVFMPGFHAPGVRGEHDCSSWMLASQDPTLSPAAVARWLEICLPIRNRIRQRLEPVGTALP